MNETFSRVVDLDKGVEEPCARCGNPAIAYHVTSGDWERYDCPKCGTFDISRTELRVRQIGRETDSATSSGA
jgi:predicted RNA-binding Zn-ribbon protein involved in translation (DUF1610 family)